MRVPGFLFLAAMLCTSCTTTSEAPEAQGRSSGDAGSAVSSTRKLRTGLPAQALEAGECGLFLWSQTEITRLVFFARAGENAASAFVEGEAMPLVLTRAGGNIFGQFLTDLTYSIEGTSTAVSVTYAAGEELEGGARISSGRISYIDGEGWTRVLPVLGVRACQPLVGSTLTPG